jgi:hypothetical protein
MVSHAGGVALLLDLDVNGWRKLKPVTHLSHGKKAQTPVKEALGPSCVEEIRQGLVEGPPFCPGNLVLAPASMPFREAACQGIGIVPEIDAGDIRKEIRHFSPHGH